MLFVRTLAGSARLRGQGFRRFRILFGAAAAGDLDAVLESDIIEGLFIQHSQLTINGQ